MRKHFGLYWRSIKSKYSVSEQYATLSAENGKIIRNGARELTEEERKRNDDML